MVLEMETRQAPPDITVIELIGRLSLGNTLQQAENQIRSLIAGKSPKLVVDLSRLEYIDSAGIGVLVMTSGALLTGGGKLRVSGATGRVLQLFEISHLDRIVSLHPDVESAVASFQTDGNSAGQR